MLNVCTPSAEEQKEIASALARMPKQPLFGSDFEVSRGRSTLSDMPNFLQAGQGAHVAGEPSVASYVRIRREFADKQAHLGLFSTLKYINANNDQKFRDKIFQFAFEDGFVFSSANFSGTQSANPFPVGFLVWDLAKLKKLETQKIEVTVLDDDASKIGRKQIVAVRGPQSGKAGLTLLALPFPGCHV